MGLSLQRNYGNWKSRPMMPSIPIVKCESSFSDLATHLDPISLRFVTRYYEGGVSSVFLWDLEDGGFAGVVLLKKSRSSPVSSAYIWSNHPVPLSRLETSVCICSFWLMGLYSRLRNCGARSSCPLQAHQHHHAPDGSRKDQRRCRVKEGWRMVEDGGRQR